MFGHALMPLVKNLPIESTPLVVCLCILSGFLHMILNRISYKWIQEFQGNWSIVSKQMPRFFVWQNPMVNKDKYYISANYFRNRYFSHSLCTLCVLFSTQRKSWWPALIFRKSQSMSIATTFNGSDRRNNCSPIWWPFHVHFMAQG